MEMEGNVGTQALGVQSDKVKLAVKWASSAGVVKKKPGSAAEDKARLPHADKRSTARQGWQRQKQNQRSLAVSLRQLHQRGHFRCACSRFSAFAAWRLIVSR